MYSRRGGPYEAFLRRINRRDSKAQQGREQRETVFTVNHPFYYLSGSRQLTATHETTQQYIDNNNYIKLYSLIKSLNTLDQNVETK